MSRSDNGKKEEENSVLDKEQKQDERIEKVGQVTLDENEANNKIHLISIIGEVEGHENLSGSSKTTKYERILVSYGQPSYTSHIEILHWNDSSKEYD